ncbi:MAG TPA: hypothetical protein DER02_01075 [Gammaproteobacteria bacterium]|nr:hypothetical protein [Gammaproteobacteria bacterium]|tara:strand:- start:7837 stop:8436 length:600 start_codon:yes stop_codon:yes gene_type:complete
MPQGRPSLSQATRDEFKQQVCEAALKIISDKGYTNLSFRVLAHAVKSSHMRILNYFQNKETLICEVRDYAFGLFGSALTEAGSLADGPLTQLQYCGHAYFEFAHSNPDAFLVLFSGFEPGKGVNTENEQRAWQALYQPVCEAVEKQLIAGNPEVLTQVFWAAIHGVTILSLNGNLPEGVSAEAVLQATFSGLLDGHRAH